ncbi:methyl-accepting chemotaxis protein [Pseudomonas luteola]|uniref:methyl-accepting chemotaxis protein n=1 Tax=Pseudomonas sp. JZ114 TaxID=2806614 RepID=UPI003DA1921A
MTLRNLNIAPRAFLGFAFIAVLTLFLGVFSLYQMRDIRQNSINFEQNVLPSITSLDEITSLTLRLRVLSYRLLINREPENLQKTLALFDQRISQVEAARTRYEKLIASEAERGFYNDFQKLWGDYLQLKNHMLQLSSANQLDELKVVLNDELLKNSDAINAVLGKLVDINADSTTKSNQSAAQSYSTSVATAITLLVIVALLTVLLAWLLTRSIVQPVDQALRAAEEIASGDLTKHIQVTGKDEPARLLMAMRTMQEKLRHTLERISGSSSQLAAASEELSSITDESARGLNRQNDEIQMAATAVTEMSSAVEEVARNAMTTSEASKHSASAAQEGQGRVLETVSSIEHMTSEVQTTACLVGELASQSRDIGKVLDVIRGLADQTNLLALNAAIEAARAGEAGRGFAVVADEVRALAHRTQESTREIEQMIMSIQNGTEQAVNSMESSTTRAGSTLEVARRAGEALEEITRAINEINERNLVIASAAEEQAQVAREVDHNLVNIRDLSVQSSEGARDTTAASQELSRLAVELNTLVSHFKV